MNREDVIREIYERYRQSGRSLNEFERRRWAATEAMKLGRGGITLVGKALRISPNTIKKGIQEIAAGQADSSPQVGARIRKPGGGRKSKARLPDQLTRTRSEKDATSTKRELSVSDCFDEIRNATLPFPIDKDTRPADEAAFAARPESPEIA